MRTITLFAAVGSLALTSAAAANHIDFFTEGSFALKLEPGDTMESDFTVDPDGDSIIGFGRNVSIMFAPGSDDGIITADLVGEGTGTGGDDAGAVVFSNSATTMGTLTLDYGTFTDFDVASNAGGDDYFAFAVDFSAVEPDAAGTLTATVTDTDGDQSTLSQPIVGAGEYLFPYDAFGGDIDFTSVDRLTFEVTSGTVGADFRLEEITRVIPEPATASLLGLAGLTLLRRRR